MNRKELAKIDGTRKTFRGVFVRYGKKSAYRGADLPTLLLRDVTEVETSNVVTDHIWFNLTAGFKAVGELNEGDILQFDARVKTYVKGYKGRSWEKAIDNPVRQDWKLSHPTKISKVND